jgi:alkylated DNA repair dioxygenase AlkB
VTCFSGDKLLGGPQGGLLVGEREAIAACRRHPLARAVRIDKLSLAALEATLALYRDPEHARREVPVLAMLTAEVPVLRERAERLAELPAGAFEQALVTRYPPAATIGWHRDAPPFGPTIVGVSLLAPCRMRFQRKLEGTRYVHEQTLEPRSAYVLAGTARSAWEHHIPPTKELRYSLTFRTIRESRRPASR